MPSKSVFEIDIDKAGNKFWYSNDQLHRTDGPAVECSNGTKYWFLYNIGYTFEEWLEITPLSDQEKVKLRIKYV